MTPAIISLGLANCAAFQAGDCKAALINYQHCDSTHKLSRNVDSLPAQTSPPQETCDAADSTTTTELQHHTSTSLPPFCHRLSEFFKPCLSASACPVLARVAVSDSILFRSCSRLLLVSPFFKNLFPEFSTLLSLNYRGKCSYYHNFMHPGLLVQEIRLHACEIDVKMWYSEL